VKSFGRRRARLKAAGATKIFQGKRLKLVTDETAGDIQARRAGGEIWKMGRLGDPFCSL
jgi:hypothetical protein